MSGLSATKSVSVDWSATVPPTGTVAYTGARCSGAPCPELGVPDLIVSVAFSGRVVVPSDCLGEYQLREEVSGNLAAAVACDKAIVEGNTAIVPFRKNEASFLTNGAYYIVVTADAVEDYGGERVMGSSSLGTWTISATNIGNDDLSEPVFVGAVPRDQEILLAGEPFELHFSESLSNHRNCIPRCLGAAGNVKLRMCNNPTCLGCDASLFLPNCGDRPTPSFPGIEVYDCGDDLACGESSDVLIASFDVMDNSTILPNGSMVVVPFPDWVLVPAGAFFDDVGNYGTMGTTEFLYSAHPFHDRRAVAVASTVTMDKVEYDLHVAADTAPGTYRICYCNSAADLSPKRAGADTSAYYLLQTGTGTPVRFTGPTVGTRPLEEHLCDPKCLQGCAGDDCFCADLDFTMSRDLYCLSPQLCADACHAVAGCVGVSIKGERCALLADLSATAAFGWATFSKAAGAPCTDPHDFGIDVGAIVVTQAVDVGVDFVVTPGKPAVLEVSGVGLMSTAPFSATEHRISGIDGFGRCGVSPPVETVD